jgi:LmbE family N-acetylglucosaminyl deacetylase
VLAVVAHPDDESFGLGAVLAALVAAGAEVRVVCLTHGEASTLGATAGLAALRAAELTAAAARLGVAEVHLHDFADGELGATAPTVLDGTVEDALGAAATLIVLERSGVTGHPDHRAATAAALRVAARRGLAVVEWGLAPEVASRLNAELGTEFASLDGDGVVEVPVDRTVQRSAIACHVSQAVDNPVLARRLELQGDVERIRLCVGSPRRGGSAL